MSIHSTVVWLHARRALRQDHFIEVLSQINRNSVPASCRPGDVDTLAKLRWQISALDSVLENFEGVELTPDLYAGNLQAVQRDLISNGRCISARDSYRPDFWAELGVVEQALRLASN
jgi:hypothetical protein